MKSIKELYRIGTGPSSSHTMGPRKAAEMFLERHPDAASFKVTLYGSLAATGKGHMTDVAIIDTLQPTAPVEIVWQPKVFLPFHPNGMTFAALDNNDKVQENWTVYSIGGGALAENNDNPTIESPDVYGMENMTEILQWCEDTGKSYWEYVKECEEEDIWDYLAEVWATMKDAIHRGLEAEGVLPGPLNLRRKASTYYIRATGYKQSLQSRGLVFSYALAVSEENASGGKIVTAPTCGSCGVMPAVLYHLQKSRDFSDMRILRALATAGLFGNIVKFNASISGAEVGCQGEVGVACAMASAAANQLFGGSPAQIEYAAEMGLEHHLGMTCDPVCGLVQIPCIERNAYAAARALDANLYSAFTDGMHRVSFDKVVQVMKQTGHDLPSLYKETSEGGLAKDYKKIVSKYMPLIQEENCKKGELQKHSHIKVICNGKLGLLQILSAYIYPPDGSEIKYQRMEQHQNKVCEAIYKILSSFSKIDIDNVKEFLQFDKLNDIFSRTYSASSIGSMSGKKTNGIIRSGAANFIYKVYENENIKQLKADDPNYWLQRAKSIYITNYRSTSDSSKDKILEAIDWAKKAEQDSRMKIDSGESRYLRTESNAIMQIAMLYGKYANMCKYIDTRINEFALEYYYKMFSDTNNIEAAKTFLYHSRGKQDFEKLLNQLVVKPDSIGKEWGDEMNFLLNIGIIRQ